MKSAAAVRSGCFAAVLLACGPQKSSCPPAGARSVPLVGAVFHEGNGVRALGSDPASQWLAQCRARASATGGDLESLAGLRAAWDCPAQAPPIDFARYRIEVLMFRIGEGIDHISETSDAVIVSSSRSAWCQGTAPPAEQPWYFVVPKKPLRTCSSGSGGTCSGGPRP